MTSTTTVANPTSTTTSPICTCTCAVHHRHGSKVTGSTQSDAYPYPSPFHSHAFPHHAAFANPLTGGASYPKSTTTTSQTQLTSPSEKRPFSHIAMSVMAPMQRVTSVGSASTLTTTSTTSLAGSRSASSSPTGGSRHLSSSNSSPHSPRDVSPFLMRKKDRASPTNSKSSTPPTHISTPIPDHIHSATCGCSHDTTIPSDDQLISDDVESGSEAFLNELNQSVTAIQSLNESLGQTETLADPNAAASVKSPSDHFSNSSANSATKWNLHSLLNHNHQFVMGKQYEPYLTDRIPYKRLVVVSCMDTRLTELLPMALDLKNGDAKIIKVAGAMVAHPFGSVMRSILVAVYALGAEHILVVGHHDCGMTGMDPNRILSQAKQRGIPDATFKTLKAAGLDLDSWLSGFDNVRDSVLHSVETIKNHPLLNFEETSVKATQEIKPGTTKTQLAEAPVTVAKTRIPKITVTGMVIDPYSGKLDLVTPTDEVTRALIEQHEKEEIEVQNSERETAAGARDYYSA